MIPLDQTTRGFQEELLRQGVPKRPTVGIVNLGCARNLVDSQVILGRLKRNGHRIVEPKGADVAVVNTCSFITEAKEESVEAILDLLELKKKGKIKKVIVAGCLAQRYAHELAEEFKEVDAFVGTLAIDKIGMSPQVLLTPRHYSYVKICESCFNQCSFCAIPKMKGKFSSRTIESVLEEVKFLDKKGVKEINIIGQDITAYGMDIYQQKSLATLLRAIAVSTKEIRWIRLLYAFPAHVDGELIDTMANEPKICRYVDMPLQHINEDILQKMNRGITKQGTINLLQKIRAAIPEASLRTTFIVGFPGEGEEQFQELLSFMKDTQFEKAGVFVYSREEGTPAFHFDGQVEELTKKRRLDTLMQEQQIISRKLQERFLGKRLDVLVEEKQKGEENIYLGRSEFDAPEVDGLVYIHSQDRLSPGDFVTVDITDTHEYDLTGDFVEKVDT